MSHRARTGVLVACDIACSLASIVIALLVRFEFNPLRALPYIELIVPRLPALLVVRIASYVAFGLYDRLWQFASVRELVAIAEAGTVASVGDYVLLHLIQGPGFPRSVTLLMWMFNIGFAGGLRLLARLRREWILTRRSGARPLVRSVSAASTRGSRGSGWEGGQARRALIIGAGEAGMIVAKELRTHPELGYDVVGFVDDDRSKQGYTLAGLRVLGTRRDLAALVGRHDVDEIIIAMPSAPGRVVKEIVAACEGLGTRVKTLPGVYELIDGKVDVSRIRDVQIEDLLRREEIKVDLEKIGGYLTGRRVLVTGAGGSIGQELCRQIARFQPENLVLLGHAENDIYDIDLELRETYPDLHVVPVIGDIRDAARMESIFGRHRPDVVFHAAAHKHVPLMEMHPEEAINNNVFGTWNVATAADRHAASRFVLISTDKAVNPVSIMGSTKRAAELLIQALDKHSKTRFMAVRFGNVLGSRGSVIPLFRRQIAAGGPITVTHPDMVRYFMTIPEAVQLVIQAAAMGEGGEVFVLDMGEPVRIVDLARDLVRLSGLDPDRDIEIKFTGVRPGEKLFEELLTAEEGTVATCHERIFIARSTAALDGSVEAFLETCRELAAGGESGGAQFVNWVRGLTNSGGGRTGQPGAPPLAAGRNM
ncbi:MAG: polysaccharide biosynthesis protein [Firmicutes bacterium]|nr:polysaccharide biosynthesis protein [Bacillota bacterium]